MTDQTTPAPESVPDPSFVDPEKPIDPTDKEQVEEIAAKAKKSFKLTDRLKGIKHRHTKVLIFTDGEAVDAYVSLNGQLQGLVDAQGNLNLEDEEQKHQSDLLVARFNELEPQAEELKVEMLQSGLSFHLVAYPAVAIKVARRETRKVFLDPETNQVPDDKQVEAQDFMDNMLLGHSIAQVVDADGDKWEFDRDTIGKELSDSLPPSQWSRLYDAWQALTLTDQISTAVTDDPGF